MASGLSTFSSRDRHFFAIARLFDFLIAKAVVAKVVVVFLGVLTPPKKQQQRFVRQDGFLR